MFVYAPSGPGLGAKLLGGKTYIAVDVLEADAIVSRDRWRPRCHGRADAEMLPEARGLSDTPIAPELDGAAVMDDAIVDSAVTVNIGQAYTLLLRLAIHDLTKILKSRQPARAAVSVILRGETPTSAVMDRLPGRTVIHAGRVVADDGELV